MVTALAASSNEPAEAAAVEAFRAMVAAQRFDVAFQPIVDANTGRVHHYEALARFPDAPGGPLPWILFAERHGLIADFDLAMVGKVIDRLGTAGPDAGLRIAVNISGVSLAAAGFLTRLERLLDDNPWTRGRLIFEITESARIVRLGDVNRFVQRLRERGHPVCIDDFGAGAANFAYLARLEVDVVKLDGEALRNARKGPDGTAFLRALVALCRDLGVGIIAEMIEDERDMRFARGCGIDYLQGYLFGRASPDIAASGAAPATRLAASPAA